jgi:hypothetical protein
MVMQELPEITVRCTSLIGPEIMACGHTITVHFRVTERKDEGPVPSQLLANFIYYMCHRVKEGSLPQTQPESMLGDLLNQERNLVALHRPLKLDPRTLARIMRHEARQQERSCELQGSIETSQSDHKPKWDQSRRVADSFDIVEESGTAHYHRHDNTHHAPGGEHRQQQRHHSNHSRQQQREQKQHRRPEKANALAKRVSTPMGSHRDSTSQEPHLSNIVPPLFSKPNEDLRPASRGGRPDVQEAAQPEHSFVPRYILNPDPSGKSGSSSNIPQRVDGLEGPCSNLTDKQLREKPHLKRGQTHLLEHTMTDAEQRPHSSSGVVPARQEVVRPSSTPLRTPQGFLLRGEDSLKRKPMQS